jgi:hypothetical protein
MTMVECLCVFSKSCLSLWKVCLFFQTSVHVLGMGTGFRDLYHLPICFVQGIMTLSPSDSCLVFQMTLGNYCWQRPSWSNV